MKEVLHFERSIPNPAGIEWVGSDLYMVAPVASAPGPRALGQSYVVEKRCEGGWGR